MPYRVVKDGNRYCVRKKNPDDSTGELIPGGCHPTRAEANKHMAARYVADAKRGEKEAMTEDELLALVEQVVAEADMDTEDDLSNIDTPEQEQIEYEPDEDGILDKAVWTTAMINDLPNGAFLYVEPGESDSSGKRVPRSKRHFPVKDSSGKYDLAHVRNAIARIPQSNAPGLSPEKKKSLQERARRILASLTKEKNVFERAIDALKEALFGEDIGDEQPDQTGLMLWKENDTLRWFTRYSNNIRDDDTPAEIISAESHQSFVDMVDKGEAQMPELWLWHVPHWKVGVADWVAYDSSGFALASGTIDRDKEAVVEQIANSQTETRVSHGMPVASILRDPDDPTIIRRHITKEISLLPSWAAANAYTGFTLLSPAGTNKEDEMAIPADKRAKMIEQWGLNEQSLSDLEAMNAQDAEKAAQEGRDSKEKEAEVVAEEAAPEAEAETTPEPVVEEQPEPAQEQQSPYPTREEIAEATWTFFKPFIEKLNAAVARLDTLDLEFAKQKQKEDDEVTERIGEIPAASLAALLAQKQRAVGAEETRVDGRETLAKQKPAMTVTRHTGIDFIDQMLAADDTPAAD